MNAKVISVLIAIAILVGTGIAPAGAVSTPISWLDTTPANNVIANPNFTNQSLRILQSSQVSGANSYSPSEWTFVNGTDGGRYAFGTLNGTSGLELTNPGQQSFLYQSLNHVRVNASTRVRFSFYFLQPETFATFSFGAFQQPYRAGTPATNAFALEIQVQDMNNFSAGWNTVDFNLPQLYSYLSGGANITGLYFSCPVLQDVGVQATGSLAVSHIMVYDNNTLPPLVESFAGSAAQTEIAVNHTVGSSILADILVITVGPPAIQIVTQTVTQVVNNTVYITQVVNRTIYVPQIINRTVTQTNTEYVPQPYPVPYIPWWVILAVAMLMSTNVYTAYTTYRARKKLAVSQK